MNVNLISFCLFQRKQEDLAWLLGVTLRTMEKASNYGQLFQYIPEFYVETVLQSMYALHCYFNPIINVEEIRGKLVFFKIYSLNYSSSLKILTK